MAKPFYFYCPHCSAKLDKGPILWAMGEKDQPFISMGSPPAATTTCPRCLKSIDTQKIIDGKYDQLEGCLTTAFGCGLALALGYGVLCAIHYFFG